MTRCNVINMLRQAAKTINPKKDVGSYAFMLEELADHLTHLRDGRVSWDDFSEFYCLKKGDQ